MTSNPPSAWHANASGGRADNVADELRERDQHEVANELRRAGQHDLAVLVDTETDPTKLEQWLADGKAALNGDEPIQEARGNGRAGRPSQATQLVDLAEELDLFHSPGSEATAYARIEIAGRHETWPLRTRRCKDWLRRLFYKETGAAPGSQAVADALGVLEGRALFDGQELPVHVRFAEFEGAYYLDLANENWEAVRITADGWEIIPDPPARFRRPKGMEALPRPARGGSVDHLRPLVNAQEREWPLFVAWMLGALNAAGPYTVLDILGEQGSGKTDGSRIARRMIDPNLADLRGRPRNSHELAIAADNAWVVGYDNVSVVPDWFSDDLAKLATGGGFGTRTLYENREEEIFQAKRPIVLNGITEVIQRPDLLDRALVLEFQPILDGRLSERELWDRFDAVRAKVLGALLDAVAAAIRGLPEVDLQHLPRMADFAEWVVAASPGLGWEPRRFLDTYSENRIAADETTLAASPLYGPLFELGDFEGTFSELLKDLTNLISEQEAKRTEWPKAAHVLSAALRRIAPNLRRVGIAVEFELPGSRRGLRITHKTGTASERPERPSVRLGGDSDASDASLQPESNDVGDAEPDLLNGIDPDPQGPPPQPDDEPEEVDGEIVDEPFMDVSEHLHRLGIDEEDR